MPQQLARGSTGRQVRLWVDELPSLARVPAGTTFITNEVAATWAAPTARSAAIEGYLPVGPMAYYGLLGGTFEAGASPALSIVAPHASPGLAQVFEAALAGQMDRVVVGGSPEYAPSVSLADQVIGAESLPCGRLTITHMAHGEVGSSRIFFQVLARGLLQLLMASNTR